VTTSADFPRKDFGNGTVLIQTVNVGRDAVTPLHPNYLAADWLVRISAGRSCMSCEPADRIVGLRGLAGTGKTTALRELAKACTPLHRAAILRANAAATDVCEGRIRGSDFAKPVALEAHVVQTQPDSAR